ncbi:hypothetical protein BOTCAL_0091g00150 [Botryotinia calthae]|uniref:Uncharacterized protein n=1 Tax=Botryotinia calthae TaxID=38488 RepID=A0A4Y8D7E3_9HELO|nr:hypothetical protein BOTCAL_0091g00150 [Botryotinia calthae]
MAIHPAESAQAKNGCYDPAARTSDEYAVAVVKLCMYLPIHSAGIISHALAAGDTQRGKAD